MDGFHAQWGMFAVLVLFGIALYAIIMLANRMLRVNLPHSGKLTTYECGVEALGSDWTQMNIRYYVFAFLFVIFDVEAVFLFPWAVILGGLGAGSDISPTYAMVVMFLFLGTLLEGLLYAWKKGVLKWD